MVRLASWNFNKEFFPLFPLTPISRWLELSSAWIHGSVRQTSRLTQEPNATREGDTFTDRKLFTVVAVGVRAPERWDLNLNQGLLDERENTYQHSFRLQWRRAHCRRLGSYLGSWSHWRTWSPQSCRSCYRSTFSSRRWSVRGPIMNGQWKTNHTSLLARHWCWRWEQQRVRRGIALRRGLLTG